MPGFAHWSVGSIDAVGTRNGCATSTSTASTTTAATASVTTHSTTARRTAAGERRYLVAQVFGGAVGGANPGSDHRLLRALVQPLAAAAHRGEEAVEIDFERREHPVGPVLHLEPRFARLSAGVVDDVLRLALRDLDDLGLRRLADGLLAGLGK